MAVEIEPLTLRQRVQQIVSALADFDQVRKSQVTVRTREELERFMMLSVSAEIVGVSISHPHLVLALMPYFVPNVYQWRRQVRGFADLSGEVPLSC